MKTSESVAKEITHQTVYEQCGKMKKYYDPDYSRQYPLVLAAVESDHRKSGRYPTDQEIETMVAGTVMVIEREVAGPLCPGCGGTHDAERTDHPDPAMVADTFPEITRVVDEYNS